MGRDNNKKIQKIKKKEGTRFELLNPVTKHIERATIIQ